MPGILYVVATPIGNLEDVTLRALRVLREVSLIAVEDTRRTARLLQHYSIPTPTTSLHAHNERTKTAGLIERLRRGESIALVSDAGTPVISDPGVLLVSAAHREGIKVEPIPGPSAPIAALSAAGVASDGFVFAGFPPARANARKKWLQQWQDDDRAVVLFEAPHRIESFLRDLLLVLGDRMLTVARELTKAHGELVNRPTSQHLSEFREGRGEFTIILHPPVWTPSPKPEALDPSIVRTEFGRLTDIEGLTRREALRSLAKKYGVPARQVYQMLEGHTP